MFEEGRKWLPGSFTKNFSWGPKSNGLQRLHDAIRIGFNNKCEDIERELFRRRLDGFGAPDFIPLNFFLFNYIEDGRSVILADELVYQATKFDYSDEFDCLALGALHLSYVGHWVGQREHQSQPSLWAKNYARDVLGPVLNWELKKASADSIAAYLKDSNNYQAAGERKLSTNLNYIYQIANTESFGQKKVNRCWVSTVFLMLDRLKSGRREISDSTNAEQIAENLRRMGALNAVGSDSLEKRLAIRHIAELHFYCGGLRRFNDQEIVEFAKELLSDAELYLPNDDEPILAIHPSNLRISKVIPKICSHLAQRAGFLTLIAGEVTVEELRNISRKLGRTALNELEQSTFGDDLDLPALLEALRER